MKNKNNCIFENMRPATIEEQKSIQKHIDEISEPTGINFWDDLKEKENEKN